MRIYIKHINNTYNYGSCMMAITLIRKLNSIFENVEFYVDARSSKDLERLILETGVRKIHRDNLDYSKKIINRVINKLRYKLINYKVSRIENVIIIGGDDISEYYGVDALINELNKLREESINKKVILLGQTIGPFTEDRGKLACECLCNTKIYTRDDNCFKYLEELNFKNIKRGRDLAFLQLPMQMKAKYILKKYDLQENEYVTIVPSGLSKSYTKNFDNYIEEQLNIISNLIENKRLKDKKLVLLPHVLIPKHVDDRLIIREIKNRVSDSYKERVIFIDDEMLPSEAREILGNGLFTITGRMHAAVSTFFMRKPAISLSYSVKYSGVIGSGLDLNELVIECANEELWNKKEISIQVSNKTEYILDNYDELINKINRNVNEVTKITNEQLDNLIKDIKR